MVNGFTDGAMLCWRYTLWRRAPDATDCDLELQRGGGGEEWLESSFGDYLGMDLRDTCVS